MYRVGLDTDFISHSPDLHNHCLVFVPSLWTVAHVEREERRIITTVVMFAWYLGVCRYCREVWILSLCGGVLLCWSVRVCLLLGAREWGLWTVGLSEGVKDYVLKYGLVFV
jgi:hypothetical protein